MQESLTIEEIRGLHPSEWVLVGAPITDRSGAVIGGRVLFHSLDRDQVYRQARRLRPNRFAMLYLGTLPKDAAIVL